jgi:hypothetical protein
MEQQKVITIGSDAELCFAINKPTNNNFYSASNFLTRSLTTQLGCDGCSAIAEIRPNYAYSPIEHIGNIKKILQRLKVKMENEDIKLNRRLGDKESNKFKLLALAGNGFRNAIGGHIHFGVNIEQNKDLLKLLDILSIFLMPMELKKNALNRRTKSGYGCLSAYERKSYGFEYRTLASWLYSESNARSILCLAYTLVYEYINNPKIPKKMIKSYINKIYRINEEKLRNRGQRFYEKEDKVNHFFKYCEKDYFIKNDFNLFNYFMKNVRKMEKYKEFKPYIENLFSLYALKKKFKENRSLINYWNFKKVRIHFFKFSNDNFLNDIKKGVKNNLITDNKNLYVYGLQQKRNLDVGTNNSKILDLVKLYNKKNKKEDLKIALVDIYNYESIGFGYELREKNKEYIAGLLEFIKKNIKKKNLKNSYEEKIDYEEKQAETDSDDEEEDDEYCDDEDDGGDY